MAALTLVMRMIGEGRLTEDAFKHATPLHAADPGHVVPMM